MVNTKSLLSIVIYTSLSTAIPLTPQRGTQWQENEKSRSPSTQVVVPVPEVAPIKITIPISRIELSRISHPRAQSIVIVPSNLQNQNSLSPTQSSPEIQQQQPNSISKPTSLSEQIEAYKPNPIIIPPSTPNSKPKERTPCAKATMEAKRKMFASQTKMLVRIGKGRLVWAVLQKGKWVGVEGVSHLVEVPKKEGVVGLEETHSRGKEQVGEL